MKAKELMLKYEMNPHSENGKFVEKHYLSNKPGRADSGSIYYYVEPGEVTQPHKIDCDEYWVYNAGSTLELCLVDGKGNVCFHKLGTDKNNEPMIFIPKGTIFASKNTGKTDGTFITCITVPRFSYEGFTMFSAEEIIEKYPQTKTFFE